jgi:sugar O-acyltransferase (sialic acid O-acetyltransferase NeuD family)
MKVTVLGYSEAALTMILDILESQHRGWDLEVINNLQIKSQKPVTSQRIKFNISDSLPGIISGKYLMGAIKVESKLTIFNIFKVPVENYLTIQHSSAILSNTLVLGKGCVLNAGSIIAGQSILGNFVYINRKVSIGHHTIIGDFSTVNPGCNIAGNVFIGEKCLIGMGTNIIDNITIGNNSIIGAGSLVTRDIPANCVAYGNPCKVIRENVPDQEFSNQG